MTTYYITTKKKISYSDDMTIKLLSKCLLLVDDSDLGLMRFDLLMAGDARFILTDLWLFDV
jgi:hypothetical protein